MKDNYFTFRIKITDLHTGDLEIITAEENYITFFHLWEELCLRMFHPTEYLYKIAGSKMIEIIICRNMSSAIILESDLDLSEYIGNYINLRGLHIHLGLRLPAIFSLMRYKFNYIAKYHPGMTFSHIPLPHTPVFIPF